VVEGLRERKKLRTRGDITAAALRLFAERGFDGTTVDDIAAAADVSRRTFFRYFARKEDVILAWKSEMALQLRAALADRPASESAFAAAHQAMAKVSSGYAALPQLALGLLRLFELAPVLKPEAGHDSWDVALTEGIAARLGVDPARDPRPRLVALVSFAVLNAAVQEWGGGGGEADLLELLDASFAALRQEARAG
jgi:AcrR family transcriptional regulator